MPGGRKPRADRCAIMPWGVLCGDLMRVETRKSRLERLPEAVFCQVLGLLGYRERIFLAATNKRLRKRVGDPAVGGSILERSEFFSDVAKRIARAGGNDLACYGCWRFKDRTRFSEVQRQLTSLDRSWFFLRRCCACLQLYYGRGSGTEAGKAALLRFRKQGVCTRCNKMRFWDEECEGCAVRDAKLAEYARLGAVKRQEREQRGEVEVLGTEDPGVVDWLENVGLADPWPWAHSRVPAPVEEREDSEDEEESCDFYSLVDEERDLLGPGLLECMNMVRLQEGEDEEKLPGPVVATTPSEESTEQPLLGEPLPSQTGSDAASVRRGFEVWLVYNRFLGRTTSNMSATETSPAKDVGESSSASPPRVETIEEAEQVLDSSENETHSRHRRRFLGGEMTVAEQSLYLRIQSFMDRQVHRRQPSGEQQEHQEQRRPSRILELVSERLRALGSRMASRRTEVTA